MKHWDEDKTLLSRLRADRDAFVAGSPSSAGRNAAHAHGGACLHTAPAVVDGQRETSVDCNEPPRTGKYRPEEMRSTDSTGPRRTDIDAPTLSPLQREQRERRTSSATRAGDRASNSKPVAQTSSWKAGVAGRGLSSGRMADNSKSARADNPTAHVATHRPELIQERPLRRSPSAHSPEIAAPESWWKSTLGLLAMLLTAAALLLAAYAVGL